MTNSNSLHFAAMAALGLALFATPANAGQVSVSHGWFRVLPANLPAGGYFDLTNGTDKTLTLTSASSPACGMLMLHKSENMSGMEHMIEVKSIDIAPGTTLKFAPGGYHLMCMHAKMERGSNVPVTLDFADGNHIRSLFKSLGPDGK